MLGAHFIHQDESSGLSCNNMSTKADLKGVHRDHALPQHVKIPPCQRITKLILTGALYKIHTVGTANICQTYKKWTFWQCET